MPKELLGIDQLVSNIIQKISHRLDASSLLFAIQQIIISWVIYIKIIQASEFIGQAYKGSALPSM